MTKKQKEARTKEILSNMAAHGHSPSAQAQNLADFAAIMLEEQFGITPEPGDNAGELEGDGGAQKEGDGAQQ